MLIKVYSKQQKMNKPTSTLKTQHKVNTTTPIIKLTIGKTTPPLLGK